MKNEETLTKEQLAELKEASAGPHRSKFLVQLLDLCPQLLAAAERDAELSEMKITRTFNVGNLLDQRNELRAENERWREQVRCLVQWCEGCAMRLPPGAHAELNWRTVNEARAILKTNRPDAPTIQPKDRQDARPTTPHSTLHTPNL